MRIRSEETKAYQRRFQKERRKRAKQMGLCSRCCQERCRPNRLLCEACREYCAVVAALSKEQRKKNEHNRRRQAKLLGNCQKCFKLPAIDNRTMCRACLDKNYTRIIQKREYHKCKSIAWMRAHPNWRKEWMNAHSGYATEAMRRWRHGIKRAREEKRLVNQKEAR